MEVIGRDKGIDNNTYDQVIVINTSRNTISENIL